MKLTMFSIPAFALLVACGGTVRSEVAYRNDTQKLLATRDGAIRECYDRVLANDATARGTLTVQFTVEKKTGKIVKAAIDPAKSQASEPIVACVVQSIEGLQLQPPDRNEGKATFQYAFEPAAASN